MAKRFENQVVLITGASEGIGRGLAIQLASEGANLALVARNQERLQQTVQACEEHGASALAIPADLAERSECQRLVETTINHFGRLDMLINNAGISMYAKFADVRDLGMLERMMRVNFLAAMYCTSHALPELRAARGRVVAVSSLAAKIVAPGSTMYAASKLAMRGFFDALRTELKADGVSVTVAYPGFVRTEIYGRFLDAEGKHGPDMSSRIPRWATRSIESCSRRILTAAHRRRREVPPTFFDRGVLLAHSVAPRLIDHFWQRTLRKDFPQE